MQLCYEDLEVVLNCLVRDADYWNDAEYEDKEFKVNYCYEVKENDLIYCIMDLENMEFNTFEEEDGMYEIIKNNLDTYLNKHSEEEIKNYFEDEARAEAEEKGENYFF